MTPPLLRTARLAGIVVLLAVAWVFWPTALGGGTTYVSTDGVSMEPMLHTGDLVVVREAGSYDVGDVVAYNSASLGTTVLHRIVQRDGERFVISGDNNSWLDPDRPTTEEIVGRMWVTIPQGGHWIAVLGLPLILTVLLGVAVLTVLKPAKKRRAQTRAGAAPAATPRDARRRTRRPAGSLALSPRAQAHAWRAMPGFAAVVAVAALAAVALLIHPAVRSADQAVAVTQQGRFAYTGTAVVGATYPDGRIETGDPIYTRLLEGLTVTFTDSVSSAMPVEGTVRLDVTVTTADGWSAPLTTGAPADFIDGRASASVPLDVAAATALIGRHESEVGSGSGSASLTVTPAVDLSGAAEGRAFTAPFDTGFTFVLDPVSVRPADDAPGALTPTAETDVPVRALVPTSFSAFGQTLSIVTARRIAGAVLLLALAGGLVCWSLGRRRPSDDVERFLARHGARVVPVSGFTLGALVVDVEDGATLARVAERNEQFLLHHAAADRHTFLVQDDATTYRFVIPVPAPEAAPPPLVHPLPRIA